MTKTYYQLFLLLASYSIILPLIVSIFRFRKLNQDLKLLSVLLGVGLIVEISARILFSYKTNNLFLSHIYVPIEFILISFIYQFHLTKYITRLGFRGLMLAFILFCIINVLFIQDITQFNSYPRALESFIVIIYTLLYFYKIFQEVRVKYLEKDYMFWISVGFLLYFAGSLFLFTFANFMVPQPTKYKHLVWEIHGVLNILLYILHTIALCLPIRK